MSLLVFIAACALGYYLAGRTRSSTLWYIAMGVLVLVLYATVEYANDPGLWVAGLIVAAYLCWLRAQKVAVREVAWDAEARHRREAAATRQAEIENVLQQASRAEHPVWVGIVDELEPYLLLPHGVRNGVLYAWDHLAACRIEVPVPGISGVEVAVLEAEDGDAESILQEVVEDEEDSDVDDAHLAAARQVPLPKYDLAEYDRNDRE